MSPPTSRFEQSSIRPAPAATLGASVRPDSTWGTRTYYLNDGDDVALTLVRGSGPTWRYHQRYLLTGLDEVAALRLSLNGVPTNLAVVADRQGSFLMAVDAAGAEEPAAGFYLTGPFGQLESGSAAATDGGTHAGLGFTGAGTGTPSGGYVYLRNRWYDPRTGRFLSQDPIGLAGGVNLYAYAGNNPIAYSDPFGLCEEERDADGNVVVTACEKLARLADSLAAATESDAEFVDAFAELVAGFPGGVPTMNPEPVGAMLGESGFRADMIDGDNHPSRHFVAYVALGYRRGSAVGNLAAIAREIPGACKPGAGCSRNDIRLGKAGTALGTSLRRGWLTRRAVGQWIRDNL